MRRANPVSGLSGPTAQQCHWRHSGSHFTHRGPAAEQQCASSALRRLGPSMQYKLEEFRA
eukprot:129845-Rhodomonas_salina.1